MPEAPAALASNLGPGPRAFLLANPPSRGPVGSLPSPGLSQLQQYRALRSLVADLRAKYAPQQVQQILQQMGIVSPEPGPTPDGSGIGSTSGAPTGYSDITGYDPSLVGMGAKFATTFAPSPFSLAASLGSKALQSFTSPSLSVDVGGVPTPASYIGGSLIGSINPFSGNFLGGALPSALGIGPNAGLPSFVSGIPGDTPSDEFGLANMAPQISLGYGFGPQGQGYGSLGAFGSGTTGSTFGANQGEFAGGPVGQQGVPAAGNPAGGYGNPSQSGLANSPAVVGQFGLANTPSGVTPAQLGLPTPPTVHVVDQPDVPSEGLGDDGGIGAAAAGAIGEGPGAGGVGAGTAGEPGDAGAQGGPGTPGDGGGGGAGDGGTVICTELHRQGLMDEETWAADVWFGLGQAQETLDGYHRWAIPVAKAMHRSKLVTALVAPLALRWAQEMAFRMGAKPKGSRVGQVIMAVGIPICKWLGYNSRKGAVKV